jgi:hypothetical protein
MTYFLNTEHRTKLANKLRDMGVSPHGIKEFTEIPDDLKEVDRCMTAHVMSCIHFKNKHNNGDPNAKGQLIVGITCLLAMMLECGERNITSADLPVSTFHMDEYNQMVAASSQNLQ